ncbi:papC C-terminal domain protein [Burkholderia cepacia]|nr:FimD/PapC C-terminal domain-containing protein [Burkholderia cepacia]MDW9249256.1 papC C-terminal domain protein [Burkholderia cepacia]
MTARSLRKPAADPVRREDGKRRQGAVRRTAYSADGKMLGMVDSDSRVLVFGVQDQGRLSIRWSEGTCEGTYALPEQRKSVPTNALR